MSLVICAWILGACAEPTAPASGPPQSGPNSDLFDGRNGAASGFYFLPPIAPPQTHGGEFDPNRLPVVEICALDLNGCGEIVARYTTTSGSGSERVRVSVADEQYIVQWKTSSPAQVNVTYRVRILEGGSELGHADVRLLEKSSQAKSSGGLAILAGSTLPIKFRIEKSTIGAPVSATVGVGGGTVQVPLGGGAIASITIPAGALTDNVAFTFTPRIPANGALASFVITPGDLLFLKPVTIAITLMNAIPAPANAFAALSVGIGKANPLILPTTQAAQGTVFSASTSILGSPQPSVLFAAATRPEGLLSVRSVAQLDDDGTAVELFITTVQARIDALLAAAAQLEADESFEGALVYRIAAASLAQFIGSDQSATTALEGARTAACGKLGVTYNLAEGRLGSQFSNLWAALRPVLAWTAAAAAVEVTEENCPAYGTFNPVMNALISQFVDLYTHAMDRSTFAPSAPLLQDQLYDALAVRKWGELLGMNAAFDNVKTNIQLPLVQRYRKAAYDYCRTDQQQQFLGDLFKVARNGEMFARLLPPVSALRQPVVANSDFGFDQDDLENDLQLCGTDVTVRNVDSQGARTTLGNIGGGSDPGVMDTEIDVDVKPHGSIELDNMLLAFHCTEDIIGDDRIGVDFNGVRVKEFLRVEPTAQFIRSSPRVLSVDSLAAAGNVDLAQGGVFALVLSREGNSCNGAYALPNGSSSQRLLTLNLKYPSIHVAIDPPSASLQPGGQRTFTATVTGTATTGVTWTATGGTFTTSGNSIAYTAGNSTGSFVVKATSIADTTRSAMATLQIDDICIAAAISISVRASLAVDCGAESFTINPGSAFALPGQTVQFTTVSGDGSNPAVTWTATGGTISSTGLFTAGSARGDFKVMATVTANPQLADTADIAIGGGVIGQRSDLSTAATASVVKNIPCCATYGVGQEERRVGAFFTTYEKNFSADTAVSWEDAPNTPDEDVSGTSHGSATAHQKTTFQIDSASGRMIGFTSEGAVSGNGDFTGRGNGAGSGAIDNELIFEVPAGGTTLRLTLTCTLSRSPDPATSSMENTAVVNTFMSGVTAPVIWPCGTSQNSVTDVRVLAPGTYVLTVRPEARAGARYVFPEYLSSGQASAQVTYNLKVRFAP